MISMRFIRSSSPSILLKMRCRGAFWPARSAGMNVHARPRLPAGPRARQENASLAHVWIRPRSRVWRQLGTGDWGGSGVPEPAEHVQPDPGLLPQQSFGSSQAVCHTHGGASAFPAERPTVVRVRDPRVPLSSRGLPILAPIHPPRAASHDADSTPAQHRVIVDLIDATKQARTQEP